MCSHCIYTPVGLDVLHVWSFQGFKSCNWFKRFEILKASPITTLGWIMNKWLHSKVLRTRSFNSVWWILSLNELTKSARENRINLWLMHKNDSPLARSIISLVCSCLPCLQISKFLSLFISWNKLNEKAFWQWKWN